MLQAQFGQLLADTCYDAEQVTTSLHGRDLKEHGRLGIMDLVSAGKLFFGLLESGDVLQHNLDAVHAAVILPHRETRGRRPSVGAVPVEEAKLLVLRGATQQGPPKGAHADAMVVGVGDEEAEAPHPVEFARRVSRQFNDLRIDEQAFTAAPQQEHAKSGVSASRR